MQQNDPMWIRPSRRLRGAALGVVGILVAACGVGAGAGAAFADNGNTTFGEVQHDFAAGLDVVTLGGPISGGTLTLSPNTSAGFTTLDLNGQTMTLQAIELTTGSRSTPSPSDLVIVGPGALTVTQSDPTLPAIEVSSGSSLTIAGGTVTAQVPSGDPAAAIGGGPSASTSAAQTAGTVSINGSAVVSATGGGAGGAAIGGGAGGSGSVSVSGSSSVHVTATSAGSGAAIGSGAGATGSVQIYGDANVTATTSGTAAAIGDGGGASGGVVQIASTDALPGSPIVEAHQNGTTNTGAAIGGGASPAGQTSGSVSVGNEATVTAYSSGKGAAIGGGYHGDGGQISISGYSSVTADASHGEAGIGDGEASTSTGSGSFVTISGTTTVVAEGGSQGGAGIGGSYNSYGSETVNIGGRANVTASAIAGPGIGGLRNSIAGSVTVSDNSTLSATGGGAGAAIGAGNSSSIGAEVTISQGASVTVSAQSGAPLIGGGSASTFGSFSNAGTLTVPAGQTLSVPLGAGLTNSGVIENAGTIAAAGTLENDGSIINATGSSISGAITGNNYHVIYDAQAGSGSTEQRVFAPSVSAADLSFPSAMPPSVGSFTGWNRAYDGSAAAFTATGLFANLGDVSQSSDGNPVDVRVYALYQLRPVLPSVSSLAQAVVGTAYSTSVAATTGSAPITYKNNGSLPAGLNFDTSTGAITGTPTTAGTFTLNVTASNGAGAVSSNYELQIVPTPLTLSVPATAKGTSWYLAGSTATLTIGGLQANETYTVKIGGKTAAAGKAASNKPFTLKVTIPKSIGDGSQTVSVSGGEHVNAASSKILTASVSKALSLKLSAKEVKHGKKIVITISKLYTGESARVVISGKHGKTAVGKATSKGVYVVTLKSGLAKGKYTVTVTGAGTGRKASAKLTVS